jgi:hypothetical protein
MYSDLYFRWTQLVRHPAHQPQPPPIPTRRPRACLPPPSRAGVGPASSPPSLSSSSRTMVASRSRLPRTPSVGYAAAAAPDGDGEADFPDVLGRVSPIREVDAEEMEPPRPSCSATVAATAGPVLTPRAPTGRLKPRCSQCHASAPRYRRARVLVRRRLPDEVHEPSHQI